MRLGSLGSRVRRVRAEEGCSLENALGVLGVEGEEGTGGLTELGEGVLDAPDLALAAEAVLSDELELGIEAFLLVRTTGRLEGLAVVSVHGVGRHGGNVSFSLCKGGGKQRYGSGMD